MFTVEVRYCATRQFSIAPISDVQYTIGKPAATVPFAAASFSDLACLYSVAYVATFTQNGSSIATPASITFNSGALNFVIYTTDPLAMAVYQVTLTASIP